MVAPDATNFEPQVNRSGGETAAPVAGIPATNFHVRLSYGDFSRFTTVTPAGAAGPALAANPFVGPNPLAKVDPTAVQLIINKYIIKPDPLDPKQVATHAALTADVITGGLRAT